MSGITLYYAPVRRGFTQRGTMRCAMRRDTRRGVTIVFFATDQSESLWANWTQMRMLSCRGIPRHFRSLFLLVLLSVPRFGPPFSKMAAV